MSGPIFLVLRFLLTTSLYLFLGWALFLLWKDVRQQATLLAKREIPPLSLTIQNETLPTQIRHFTQPEIVIGRDPACECLVEDSAISTRHARLSHHHGQWWLADLDSTNGVLLNKSKVETPTVVVSGDEFECGTTMFTIILTGGQEVTPAKADDGEGRKKWTKK